MISTAFAATDAHHSVPFYADASFWVGLALVITVVLFGRKVYQALGAGLDARAAKIKARLDEAHKLREDAQEMLATYQRKQRDAMKEAEEIIAHARAEAQRLSEQAAKDLEQSLKRREKQAMDRIATAEAQALREVQNLAVDVAINAARKVIGESLSSAQAASLVDSAIAELPRKFH